MRCPIHCPTTGVFGGLFLGSLFGLVTDGAKKMTKTKETTAAETTGSRPWRHPLFWGVCLPMLPSALVGVFGWWLLVPPALAVVGAVAVLMLTKRLHRHVIADASPAMRAALAARWIPVAGRPALPRAMERRLPAPWRVVSVHKVPDPRPRVIEPARVIPPGRR
jgi:hypothetical protein